MTKPIALSKFSLASTSRQHFRALPKRVELSSSLRVARVDDGPYGLRAGPPLPFGEVPLNFARLTDTSCAADDVLILLEPVPSLALPGVVGRRLDGELSTKTSEPSKIRGAGGNVAAL